jgi:hypothetical protein
VVEMWALGDNRFSVRAPEQEQVVDGYEAARQTAIALAERLKYAAAESRLWPSEGCPIPTVSRPRMAENALLALAEPLSWRLAATDSISARRPSRGASCKTALAPPPATRPRGPGRRGTRLGSSRTPPREKVGDAEEEVPDFAMYVAVS